MLRASVWWCVLGWVAGVAAASSRATPADPFAACLEGGSAAAPSFAELQCLYRAGVASGRLDEARSRLTALGGGKAEHPWPTLVLAAATQAEDRAAAIRLFELAAAGFARLDEAEGGVLARHNLRNLYHRQGDAEAAARQVELALALARRSPQPVVKARAAALEAGHLAELGQELGRAQRLLLEARDQAFPDGPLGLRLSILFALGNVSLELGRFEEAIEAYETHRRLQAEDGSTLDAASVRFNLLTARLTRAEQLPRRGDRERLLAEARSVLAEAEALAATTIVAHAERVLGELGIPEAPAEAEAHFARCHEVAVELDEPGLRSACLQGWARLRAQDGAAADRLSRQAIGLASESPSTLAYAWAARMRLLWELLPAAEATPAALEALTVIERFRSLQGGDGARAAAFGGWARHYAWLVGRLLSLPEPRVAAAFEVGERQRARVLLEQLARAGVGNRPVAVDPTSAEGERLLAIQRRLLDGDLGAEERRALRDELSVAELRVAALDPGAPVVLADGSFATLAAVQRELAPDEALLWYQLAPWQDVYGQPDGGSWLLVVSRDRVDVRRLPDRVELEERGAAFLGLLARREAPPEQWQPAAERLGTDLLGTALAGLPAGTDRLIVVSDGILHRLPFEALRLGPDAALVGERYALTQVPSATLWLRLRRAPDPHGFASAVVLADPALPGQRGQAVSPLDGRPLARLPWARREARAIERELGWGGPVHTDAAANEAWLRQAPLDRYAVLHLAAHAWADGEYPERSAVLLAPGASGDDGWLQPREIANLPLAGKLVVLSACESASGRLYAGEGVLSLARAFFQGGARAVIGTRWPLRDDDAYFIFERFYRGLGDGLDAASALARARREAREAGLPAEAWAGVVMLGDGRLTVPRGLPIALLWALQALAVGAVLAAAWWLDRARRRRLREGESAYRVTVGSIRG